MSSPTDLLVALSSQQSKSLQLKRRSRRDRRSHKVALFCVLSLLLNSVLPCRGVAQDPTVTNCRSCHLKVTKLWRESAHARALKSLPPHERNAPQCRACHDDSGLRQLVREQLTVRLSQSSINKQRFKTHRAYQDSLKPTGVDCISCHGDRSQEIKSGHHVHQPLTRINAPLLCQRCHQLPPLSGGELCFTAHGLVPLSNQRCSTHTIGSPSKRDASNKANLHHDRLKSDHAQGTTPQHAQTSLE
jgi:hypothetical protein